MRARFAYERNKMKRWMISLICLAGYTATAEESAWEAVRVELDEAAEMLADTVGDWRERAERPFLGIVIAPGDAKGIRVARVTSGGGAEDAGIRAEDLIVRINDTDLTGSSTPIALLQEMLDEVEAGDTVTVGVLRDGAPLAVEVTPQRAVVGHILEPGDSIARVVDGWRWNERRREKAFGFKLVDIGETLGAYFGVDRGVLVLTADDDSALLPGDIVQRVGDDEVENSEAAYLAFAETEEATQVLVRRNDKREVLTMAPIEGVKVRKSLEYKAKY